MANRSYLYAADSLPTEQGVPRPVRCVSEHNWSIPLAHLLLAGHEPAVVPSMIWNHRICVAADYAAGADLLTALLRLVGEGEVDDREGFDDLAARTALHLEKQRSRHFLLEPGEIFSINEEDLATAAQSLIDVEIDIAVTRARAALDGRETAWLEELRKDWSTPFASFYADHLYYSFPDD
ncbi:DUF7822 domain-containing protein [Actinocorallia populi]|uniref:DUF7822 domain-containing protein n=1 Tax=Actinocorallia populi TaxID=2079200 RepID=UPI000D094B47|nr:hypothetical protein [Actinocorallia populi]